MSINGQSLNAKFDDLKLLLNIFTQHEQPIQIVCLQETWNEDASLPDLSLFQIHDYNLVTQDRFFYRPPHTQVTQLISFIDYVNTTIAQFEARNETTYVCGDYNINLLLINENINCSRFFECMLGFGYLPFITLPTRLSDNSTLIHNIIYNTQINLILQAF